MSSLIFFESYPSWHIFADVSRVADTGVHSWIVIRIATRWGWWRQGRRPRGVHSLRTPPWLVPSSWLTVGRPVQQKYCADSHCWQFLFPELLCAVCLLSKARLQLLFASVCPMCIENDTVVQVEDVLSNCCLSQRQCWFIFTYQSVSEALSELVV